MNGENVIRMRHDFKKKEFNHIHFLADHQNGQNLLTAASSVPEVRCPGTLRLFGSFSGGAALFRNCRKQGRPQFLRAS